MYEMQIRSFDREGILRYNWKINYGEEDDVSDIVFDELSEKVKDSCNQFELDFETKKPDVKIDWVYRLDIPQKQPEPELTEDEKAEIEALKERARQETIERRANAVPIEDLFE